jgi:dTDP-4-dehydrorhamnose reductase
MTMPSKPLKILLFGKGGQVGWELQRSLAALGDVVALDSGDTTLCGDFTDLDGIAATVRTVQPDIIVNAAAHTAVDKAESEPDLCRTINALAPGVLAREAAACGAWLVHYSTDYVFNGGGEQPWSETDSTGPLSVYGSTKLEGEQAIQASGCKHLIFRTSWVYAARGGNFAKTMLRLAGERDKLACAARQRPELAGVYHLAAAGSTSWHGYASLVIETARNAGVAIKVAQQDIAAVTSDAFPTPAPRPKNSRLNTGKLQAAFDLTLPQWQQGVIRMLTEILEK